MEFTPLHAVEVVLAGAVTGTLGAILGTGGGVFLIPILVLVLGVPVHYAVATSILSVIATSSAVASTNVERGTANMRLGMVLEVATALGAIMGGLIAGWLAPRALEGLFAVVLLPTALLMWRGRKRPPVASAPHTTGALQSPSLPGRGQGRVETSTAFHPSPSLSPQGERGFQAAAKDQHLAAAETADSLGLLGARFRDDATGAVVAYRVNRLWAGMGIAIVAGNVSGLLGIGGGIFKVPALHLLCDVPIKAAAATSNFMIGVTAAASAFLYYGRGEVRPSLTAGVVLGVLAGSALGSVVNRWVGGAAVRRLFAVLLAAVAVQMLLRACFFSL